MTRSSNASTALPAMDVAGVPPRPRRGFADAGIDALLVTHLPNVRYLTGFTGSSAMLLVTDDALVFTYRRPLPHASGRAARRRRRRRARSRSAPPSRSSATRSPRARRPRPASASKRTRSRWAQQRDVRRGARRRTSSSPTDGLVERLRRVKEPGEVARIHAACAIADDALGALLPRLAERPTERDFALELEVEMRRRGASGNSFDPIVASGPNAAKPHAAAERPRRSSRASSSSSTSVASSTATAPT